MSDDLTVNGQVPRVPDAASAVVAALPGDTGGHLFDQGVFQLTDDPTPPPAPQQHGDATGGVHGMHPGGDSAGVVVALPSVTGSDTTGGLHGIHPGGDTGNGVHSMNTGGEPAGVVHQLHPQVQRRTKPVYTQEADHLSDALPHVRRPTYTADPIHLPAPPTSQQVAVTVSGGVPTGVPPLSHAVEHDGSPDVFGSTGSSLANGQALQPTHNQFAFGEHGRGQRVVGAAGGGAGGSAGGSAVNFSFGGDYMPSDADGQFGGNGRFENELPNVVYDMKEVEKPRAVDSVAVPVAVPVVTPSVSTGLGTSSGLSAGGTPTVSGMGSGGTQSGDGIKSPTPVRVNQAGPLPYGAETVDKCVECDVCGSLFGDAGSLKRHYARAHRPTSGKGPVYCSHCSASLKNEQNLRRHIAVCHSGSQENRCDMCSASFSSRGSLRIHQQTVHSIPQNAKAGRGRGRGRGGVGKPKAEKSYLCDMCTDTFKWKGNLKRHRELRHLQLRPYECPICRASFGTKSNMRVHLITHNNNGAAAPPPATAGANQIPK